MDDEAHGARREAGDEGSGIPCHETRLVVPDMKLWLLRPNGYAGDIIDDNLDDAWRPWYDKAFGFIVRTETEAEARAIAQDLSGDETHERAANWNETLPVWLSDEHSTCVELTADGESGLVIRDFAAT